MHNFTIIKVHKKEDGQHCKVIDTFDTYELAYSRLVMLNRMYQTESLQFVMDQY